MNRKIACVLTSSLIFSNSLSCAMIPNNDFENCYYSEKKLVNNNIKNSWGTMSFREKLDYISKIALPLKSKVDSNTDKRVNITINLSKPFETEMKNAIVNFYSGKTENQGPVDKTACWRKNYSVMSLILYRVLNYLGEKPLLTIQEDGLITVSHQLMPNMLTYKKDKDGKDTSELRLDNWYKVEPIKPWERGDSKGQTWDFGKNGASKKEFSKKGGIIILSPENIKTPLKDLNVLCLNSAGKLQDNEDYDHEDKVSISTKKVRELVYNLAGAPQSNEAYSNHISKFVSDINDMKMTKAYFYDQKNDEIKEEDVKGYWDRYHTYLKDVVQWSVYKIGPNPKNYVFSNAYTGKDEFALPYDDEVHFNKDLGSKSGDSMSEMQDDNANIESKIVEEQRPVSESRSLTTEQWTRLKNMASKFMKRKDIRYPQKYALMEYDPNNPNNKKPRDMKPSLLRTLELIGEALLNSYKYRLEDHNGTKSKGKPIESLRNSVWDDSLFWSFLFMEKLSNITFGLQPRKGKFTDVDNIINNQARPVSGCCFLKGVKEKMNGPDYAVCIIPYWRWRQTKDGKKRYPGYLIADPQRLINKFNAIVEEHKNESLDKILKERLINYFGYSELWVDPLNYLTSSKYETCFDGVSPVLGIGMSGLLDTLQASHTPSDININDNNEYTDNIALFLKNVKSNDNVLRIDYLI